MLPICRLFKPCSIIFFPTESIESVKDRLIQCLNIIIEYCVSHGLQLNSDKTNAMVIGKEGIREAYQDMNIVFDGAPIECQKKIELLGYIINENVDCEEFVKETVKQCYGRLAILRKLRISSFEIRKTLAVSTILSVLDYGNSLIAGAPKHLVEKYEKIVRAVVRYIFRMRKLEPTTQNRRDLHLLDTYQRANYKVILCTWKAVHIKQPKILLDILPPRIINEKLRSASDYSRIGIPQHPIS